MSFKVNGLLQSGLSRILHIQVDQSVGKVGSGCRGYDLMGWQTIGAKILTMKLSKAL